MSSKREIYPGIHIYASALQITFATIRQVQVCESAPVLEDCDRDMFLSILFAFFVSS